MFEGREYLVSEARYLKLDIEIPYEEILLEAKNLREIFIPYRQNGYDFYGWHSLPIRGLSSKDPYSWEQYDLPSARAAAEKMIWTEIADQCPITTNWLKTVYPSQSYARVRFMLLEPAGQIGFHSDTTYSVLGAVNIALNNPDNCKWHWRDGDTLQFVPGDVYAMNNSYEHSVINDSNEDRYHLIVHHYDSTDQWKDLFTQAMIKQNVQGYFHYSTELF
jgi:hypothetical protein